MRSLLPTQLDTLADVFLHWYFLSKANKHITKLDFQKKQQKAKPRKLSGCIIQVLIYSQNLQSCKDLRYQERKSDRDSRV